MEKVVKTFNSYDEFFQPELLIKAKPFIAQIVKSLTSKYGLDNVGLVIQWNSRFRTTMGGFSSGRSSKDRCWLEFNTKFILGCMWDWDGYGQKALKNTIGHEACHFICYAKGLHYRDGADDFEQMLADNGISSSSRTATTRQKSTVPMIGYHYLRGNEALIVHIDDHSKTKVSAKAVKKLTATQQKQMLAKAEPILKKMVKDNLLQIGGPQYNDVEIIVQFNGHLRKTAMSYNYYDNDKTHLTATFNKKYVLSDIDQLDNFTMVIQKVIKGYYLRYNGRTLQPTHNIIG